MTFRIAWDIKDTQSKRENSPPPSHLQSQVSPRACINYWRWMLDLHSQQGILNRIAVRSEDSASSCKIVKESQLLVEVAANIGFHYWVPTMCLALLKSFHELAHIIRTPILQDTLSSPFAEWGNWFQIPCYCQYNRWLPIVQNRGRSVVLQSVLVSRKTLALYLHHWSFMGSQIPAHTLTFRKKFPGSKQDGTVFLFCFVCFILGFIK